MKICWNNLEKLEYRHDRGEWQDKYYRYYIYKDFCKNCSEPFLSRKDTKGEYCCNSCSAIDRSPIYGRHCSTETRKKISESNRGKIRSEEQKRNISSRSLGENNSQWKGGVTKKDISLYDTYAHQISFCEQVRKNKNDTNILEVKCAYCGKWYVPTKISIVNRIQALNGKMLNAEMRLYCSTQCKKECPIYYKHKYQVGHPKSNKNQYSREVQSELRQMCFKRDEFTCQKCGLTQNELDVGLHCHHLTGVEINPVESADVDNCITLCKECHKYVHRNICPINTLKREKCE